MAEPSRVETPLVSPSLRRWIRNAGTVLASMVVSVILWALAVRVSHAPSYIVPSPDVVWVNLQKGLTTTLSSGDILGRTGFYAPALATLQSTVVGTAIGAVIGILLGILLAEVPFAERALLPLVSGFQAVPKIGLAPLFVIWFGFNGGSHVALATTLVFFPLLLGTLNGLRAVDEDQLSMARIYNAGAWSVLWHLKLPASLPWVFTGLELGVVYALLGSIAGELIAGNEGIGAYLMSAQSVNNIGEMFALLIISGVIGGALHITVRAVRRRVAFWAETQPVLE